MKLIVFLFCLMSMIRLSGQPDSIVRVNFESNSYIPDNTQKEKLTRLTNSVNCVYEVIGYADTIGSAISNIKLSQRRADYVSGILKSSMCKPINILYRGETESFGSSLAENRTVEIKLKRSQSIEDRQQSTKVVETIRITNLQFLPDSYILTQESIDNMESVYKQLMAYSSEVFEVVGHVNYQSNKSADELKDMYKLSEDRAKTVAQLLIDKGIPAARIKFKGVGNSQPLWPKPVNEVQKRENMRVAILVY